MRRSRFFPVFLLLVALAQPDAAAYTPRSVYLLQPERNLELLRRELAFWRAAKDTVNGGFFAFVDADGHVTENRTKSLCGLSRLAYAFVRGFMVTGDTTYLQDARHALRFLYRHGWDPVHGGWFFTTDETGTPAPFNPWWDPNTWKWGFQQHYALVGIAAMVEATGGEMDWGDGEETDAAWLARGFASLNDHMWDARPEFAGYFSDADLDWGNLRGKGFTPTVDGITTNALALYLLYRDDFHRQRLLDLAQAIVEHLVASMDVPEVVFGFAENYDSDWNLDASQTGGSVGHVLKAAWCLARAYLVEPRLEFRRAALRLITAMWEEGGYDRVHGAPYGDYDWQTGQVQHTKVHWMVEQGYTAGMTVYHIAQTEAERDLCLRIADESLEFHNRFLVDTLRGGTYMATDASGLVVDATKGDAFKSAYHSAELWYLAYLYGRLFYRHEPVTLYYHFPPVAQSREVVLTPLAIEEDSLRIAGVALNGRAYADFDARSRTLHIPADSGGIFRVTFAPVSGTTAVTRRTQRTPARYALLQNFPNPFRSSTEIRYRLERAAPVEIAIYDVRGRLVRRLVREKQSAGVHQVRWEAGALPSGIYFCCLRVSGKIREVRKLQRIR